MELNFVDVLIHIVNILVLYVLLRALVYKPVRKFMQARTERIEKQLTDAKAAEQKAAEEKASYDQLLAQADDQVQQRIREGNQRAGESASEILESASKQAEELLREAKEKAKTERKEAVAALEPEIAGMAVSLAEQILQREISEEDNRQVIDTFFEKVG